MRLVTSRTISVTQSPILYGQVMASTSSIGIDNPFSALGDTFSGCYPDCDPAQIQAFEVRLSESLASSSIPAILGMDATQANIAAVVSDVKAEIGDSAVGVSSVPQILDSLEKQLFPHPVNTDVAPVVKLQFVLPAGDKKAALVIEHKTNVPKAVTIDVFMKLSQRRLDLREVDELQAEVGRLTAQLDRLGREKGDLTGVVERWQSRAEGMRRELDELRRGSATAVLDREIAGKVPELRKQLRETRDEVRRLTGELEASREENEPLMAKAKELGEVKGELEQARRDMEGLRTQLREQGEELESERSERQRIAGLLETAQSDLVTVGDEKDSIQEQLDEKTRVLEEQTRELERLREELERKNEEVEALKLEGEAQGEMAGARDEDLESLRGEVAEKETEVSRLGDEVARLTGDIDELGVAKALSEERVGELERQERELRASIERLEGENEEHLRQAEEAGSRERIEELERDLEETRRAHELTAENAREAEQALERLQTSAGAANQDLSDEVGRLKRQVQGLEGEGDAIKAAASRAAVELFLEEKRSQRPQSVVNPLAEAMTYEEAAKDNRIFFTLNVNGQTYNCALAPDMQYTIGRDGSKCNIHVDDTRVSPVHMIIKNQGGQLVFNSIKGTRGIFMGGKKLAHGKLFRTSDDMQIDLANVIPMNLSATTDPDKYQKVDLSLAYRNEEGQEWFQQYELLPGEHLTVGRKGTNFDIDERSISRRHLIIYNDAGHIRIYDTSLYGTMLFTDEVKSRLERLSRDSSGNADERMRIKNNAKFEVIEINGKVELDLNGEELEIKIVSRQQATLQPAREKPRWVRATLRPLAVLMQGIQRQVKDARIVSAQTAASLRERSEELRGAHEANRELQDELERARAELARVPAAGQAAAGDLDEDKTDPAMVTPEAAKSTVRMIDVSPDGEPNEWSFELSSGQEVIIGRNEGNDISCDSDAVSRSHAAIRNINGSYFVVDLESSNGTKVASDAQKDGIKILPNIPTPLTNGDTIILGDRKLRMVVPSGASDPRMMSAAVHIESRINGVIHDMSHGTNPWAGRYYYLQRLSNFGGIVIPARGRKGQEETILLDVYSDRVLSSFLADTTDSLWQIPDSFENRVQRLLTDINDFVQDRRWPDNVQGLFPSDQCGAITPIGAFVPGSENMTHVKAALFVLALQMAGIQAVYERGTMKSSRFGRKVSIAWIYVPSHKMVVDMGINAFTRVDVYPVEDEEVIKIDFGAGKVRQYERVKKMSLFQVPSLERLEWNLIEMLLLKGHFSQSFKEALVMQMLQDRYFYGSVPQLPNNRIDEPAAVKKISCIKDILVYFDSLTKDFSSTTKQVIADTLREIYVETIRSSSLSADDLRRAISSN